MNKHVRVLLAILVVIILLIISYSCTDAQLSKFGGLGDRFRIELINCDGTVARTWISTGKVSTEHNSDGYYFMDETTGDLIEVSGTVVITKLKNESKN